MKKRFYSQQKQLSTALDHIWFNLYDFHTGKPYKGTSADKVSLPTSANIAPFRDAVKLKYSDSHLKGIAPSDLLVFQNKDASRSTSAVQIKEHFIVTFKGHGVADSRFTTPPTSLQHKISKDVTLSLQDKYHYLSKKCSFKEYCVNLLKQMHDGQKEYLCQVIHYKDSDSGFGVIIPSIDSLIRSNTTHMTLIGFCKAELDIDNYWKDIAYNYEKCQKSVNYFASLDGFKKTGMNIEWHFIYLAQRHVLSSSDSDIKKHSKNLPDNVMIIGRDAFLICMGPWLKWSCLSPLISRK